MVTRVLIYCSSLKHEAATQNSRIGRQASADFVDRTQSWLASFLVISDRPILILQFSAQTRSRAAQNSHDQRTPTLRIAWDRRQPLQIFLDLAD
jgi:hypothetical protein